MSISQFITRFSSRVTLQIGSQGPEIRALKEVLNKFLVPSPNLAPNAAFDGQTETAVVRFQKSKGLTPNGVVDDKFYAALGLMIAEFGAAIGAGMTARPLRPEDMSFDERVDAFLAAANALLAAEESTRGVTITRGAKFRRPEDAQKWHVAHMIKFNSFPHQKPAKWDLIGGRKLIAWSHLSDAKTSWAYVRWEHFLRDADGKVPVKAGNDWAPGHAPDEAQTRQQALKILEAARIGTPRDKKGKPIGAPNSAMVACGYSGCASPCNCNGGRTNHVEGAANDLSEKGMAKLEELLKAKNAGTIDDYLARFGLWRAVMPTEPWHVEATKP